MHPLSLETFLAAGRDQESNEYRVLQGLKVLTAEFVHNRLYPALSELIDLLHALKALVQESSSLDQHLPRKLSGINLQEKKLTYDAHPLSGSDFSRVMDLIRWAIPRVEEAVEEGMKIYDFVDENLHIEEVGILPMYKEEGYYFVPENSEEILHLLRYETSLFTSGHEQFRTLKTSIVDSVPRGIVSPSPESIKLDLIERNRDLPNPATFLCETTLEFPFQATILPVAKRKLLSRVFS
ncbi:MAG: hypothetical protein HRF44_09180 [Ignavibacterium sp.]